MSFYKTLCWFGFASLFALSAQAEPIDANTAARVADYFYRSRSESGQQNHTFRLVYTAEGQGQALFYILNHSQADGYVIVAGDDRCVPILGYSTQSKHDTNRVPDNMRKWLEAYKQEIRYILRHNLSSDSEIDAQWDALKRGTYTGETGRSAVAPLIATRWDQSPFYNSLCPFDNSAGQRTVTGCVATAMAQVMKYWGHPARGTGFHSYNHSRYGQISANFGNTTYNWASMPNSVTSSNTSVATLMLHCGVSVDMNYNVSSAGGSGAQTLDVATALKTYFDYASSVQGVYRTSYTSTAWINLLKAELDAGRPMQYAGTGSGGGHSFVCDGYDNQNYFHFNWGWGGSSDGYFITSALNPGSLGTGGGSGGFNTNQRAIIGIRPNQAVATAPSLRLNSAITISPNPIQYQQAFTVNAGILNAGNGSFVGDLGAALFDASGNFVSWVQTRAETSGLQPNGTYSGGMTFSTSGLNASPGQYVVSIYSKTTNGNWTPLGAGAYNNQVSVTIQTVAQSTMRLYAALSVAPNPLVRTQTSTVSFNVWNTGSTAFAGTISAELYDLNGNFVQTLYENTSASLCANCFYNGGLSWTSAVITATPGSYQVAIWKRPSGGSWELVDNGSYQNLISVNVVEPSLSPDVYEQNNTETNAYVFNSYTGNGSINRNTVGSNIHIGSDYDHYAITLPACTNCSYYIDARPHDSYSSTNGQTYTNDVLWSYKVDNGSFSEAYDDITPAEIEVVGGSVSKRLVFKIAPYYTGEVGTYLFDINIRKDQPSGVENSPEIGLNLTLAPNPCKDFVRIQTGNPSIGIQSVRVFTMNGALVRNFTQFSHSQPEIPTDDLPKGMYFVEVKTNQGIWQAKLLVQ